MKSAVKIKIEGVNDRRRLATSYKRAELRRRPCRKVQDGRRRPGGRTVQPVAQKIWILSSLKVFLNITAVISVNVDQVENCSLVDVD